MSDFQVDILLSLIQGIEGKAWAEQIEGWSKRDLEVCTWEGIACDTTDQETVVGIELPNSRFVGTLPSELGELVSLKTLNLSQNLIEGTIPPAIAALPHLEKFNLNQNMLSGYLPLFNSPVLLELTVADNLLFGSLPSTFGDRHERLEWLDLSGNSMYGRIPASIGHMKNLHTLTLSDNNFSGTIPAALGDAALNYLYMDHNDFVGVIPPELLKPDSQLMEVWLQHNYLSGSIPAAIGSLDEIYDFYIDGNKFTGTVPEDICTENLNQDFFESAGDNEDHDFCDAISCAAGEFSFDGLYPCDECEEGTTSPYLGQVGECLDKSQDVILNLIYEKTKGTDWNGAAIQGWGTYTDPCGWTGVTCDGHGNVVALELSGMNLQGKIPEEIGFLDYLTTLDLSDNRLFGVIPSDLRWAPLTKLDVSGNKLAGVVAPMLCLKGGINKNGQSGDFNCDHIACGVGTYSETGYALKVGDCMRCETAKYLGQKTCGPVDENEQTDSPWQDMPSVPHITTGDDGDLTSGEIAGIFFGVLFVALSLFGSVVVFVRNKGNDKDAELTPEEKESMTQINPDVEFT
eukprot:CAMPEP_0172498048 /NCGR_PEP_ID=MMETSP1066-20121228/108768_1 /TAXON_ID=671091 /ORGANISM="Coscinodiscus wailesii, Strain CCMP2513" /LENGTH=571 /DNA_ID=CAMNT_0013271157 /DNA_START=164 /DNA_END=1879 /DNA_ORIENTATION=+